MIAAFIFLLHFCAVVYAFVKYKKDGIGEGFLAMAFVVIIFAVGWTIATMMAKIVYPDVLVAHWVAGLQATRYSRMVAKELTIDTFSLVLLTIGEGFFYYFYLPAGEDEEKKKQNDNGNE